jgi:hypothetical protein
MQTYKLQAVPDDFHARTVVSTTFKLLEEQYCINSDPQHLLKHSTAWTECTDLGETQNELPPSPYAESCAVHRKPC